MIRKLRAGNYKIPVSIEEEKGRLYLQFPFNRSMLAEVKSMHNARWHGYDDPNPRKLWSIKDCARNKFQLDFLAGKNPYEAYESELKTVTFNRDILYDHQKEMKAHALTRRQCILACEMGTGKTLVAIEAMESSGVTDWLWVGAASSLPAVELEFEVWDAKVKPIFMTYEKVRNLIKNDEMFIPMGLISDECTKIKTPTSQRSQALSILTEQMRETFDDPYIILMSGAPAPKNPGDWWHQCEVAKPGFIREGDIHKFKHRLAIIREEESITGGVYPKLITWLDDVNKCAICGKVPEEHFVNELAPEDHSWKRSENEVSYLYERMKGLVLVKFKKDCLDLPEKQFRKIVVEPTELTKKAAILIAKTESRTVTALMKLRELSDGFQYKEIKTDRVINCELCNGSGRYQEWYDPEYPDEAPSPESMESGICKSREATCTNCDGSGKVPEYERIAQEIECPKERVFVDLLDEHEAIGRFVTYAGFTASIDRLVRVAIRYGWEVIRADGRGWTYFKDDEIEQLTKKDMLKRFQSNYENKLIFIGQPGAAGIGITLTASPSCFFYSNSFDSEHRIQTMDRIHRIGMDVNRGATIIDVVHLDSDQYILNNLEKKLDLMYMTMGRLREVMI